MSLVFVDCEASGPCPGRGDLTEFGAVIHKSRKTFYGDLRGKTPYGIALTFLHFRRFLESNCESRPVFVSDNPAFDWQWINYYFHHIFGMNPFGWSARRIGDYYAGLQGDFHKSNNWKKFRKTKHDHNPVNDAMGNVEAFDRMQLDATVKKDDTLYGGVFTPFPFYPDGTGDYKMPKDIYTS